MANKRKNIILTEKEMEVIDKKLRGKKLTQQDSNRLSRQVRPKLKEISEINKKGILEKIEYNQKARRIEKNIIEVITRHVGKVSAIIVYGSAIQNNYNNYNDIDILIATETKIYPEARDKYNKIEELKEKLKGKGINADIEIYDKKTIEYGYIHSPTLIYQLKDCKVIYGKIDFSDKEKEIYNIDLKMKLDWSDIEGTHPTGLEIYKALRNVILVRLILNKIVDNKNLKEYLDYELGKELVERLKYNKESKSDKIIALKCLKSLLARAEKEVKEAKWEKIVL